MDMKVNKETLRRERELRAWTQSHLAEIADLSSRTVQRIERTGDASMESASALAAAFNLDLAQLLEVPAAELEGTSGKFRRMKLWTALGLSVSVVTGVGWWSQAAAEQVMISLAIETADSVYSNMMLVNDIGGESEMLLADQFRLLFKIGRKGEALMVSAQVYNFVEGDYRLISSPAMLIGDQQPASIKFTAPDGQQMSLQLLADF